MARDMASDTGSVPGLTYVQEGDSGIRRLTTRTGFRYVSAEGKPLRDAAALERIHRLVLPPAWTDVWISPDPRGHIQATGRDARGRKQYRYHDAWNAFRGEHKFARLISFGQALPRLRRQVEADLALPGLPREKLLAAVVQLLELSLIRVGNAEYARTNKSFGLTTLRKRHVSLTGARAVFEFRGKSGVSHRTGVHDRRLARIIRGCQDLPGQRLFQYVGEDGERRPVESNDVNAYLRAAIGDDFSAKDFRTWAGALAAARILRLALENEDTDGAVVTRCVKAVAELLGNTPAVCRACYIHPAVFTAFEARDLPAELTSSAPRKAELALIRVLERHS